MTQRWTPLIPMLEAATGPDDELCGRAMCAVKGREFGNVQTRKDALYVKDAHQTLFWSGDRHTRPDTSIDAVVALIREKLPGWRIKMEEHEECWHVGVYSLPHFPEFGLAPEPALALLLALARAMAAKEERT